MVSNTSSIFDVPTRFFSFCRVLTISELLRNERRLCETLELSNSFAEDRAAAVLHKKEWDANN